MTQSVYYNLIVEGEGGTIVEIGMNLSCYRRKSMLSKIIV